jgi:hypothetical protein
VISRLLEKGWAGTDKQQQTKVGKQETKMQFKLLQFSTVFVSLFAFTKANTMTMQWHKAYE